MLDLNNKEVVVIGLGLSGLAAGRLLLNRGAHVVGLDNNDSEELRRQTALLKSLGARIILGAATLPEHRFDFAVLSPGIGWNNELVQAALRMQVPILGELELGFQHALCLNIAITGTNGKTTTTELVERLLRANGTRTVAAGNIGLPISALAEQSRDLDFLTLEVSSFQLETIQYFRPAIAVLLNITPDHLDRYPNMAAYIQAKGQIFKNQQTFDWAIVQHEALQILKQHHVAIPSKVITFSSVNPDADLAFDRGLIISRLPDWTGPLLDIAKCRLRGPHNAENLMAALAVGRVLRIPLSGMMETLEKFEPAAHRCEFVADLNGVAFVNDSKATNLDAVHKALLSIPPRSGGGPNIWLIAGGKDKGFDFHDLGPALSQRVKGAFLIGEVREKIRAAWSLFTPCTLTDSLLEAVHEAARNAVKGDVVLLSPACSSFDQFKNYQHRGEVFRQAVQNLGSSGVASFGPVPKDGAQRHALEAVEQC